MYYYIIGVQNIDTESCPSIKFHIEFSSILFFVSISAIFSHFLLFSQ